MITSDLPSPGKTSLTLYQSDYIQKDGFYVPGLQLSFTTSAHAEAGVRSITVDSKIGSTATSFQKGRQDASVVTTLQVTGVPPMNTAVAQTATDYKGNKSSRVFMVHIRVKRPGFRPNKAQLKSLLFN